MDQKEKIATSIYQKDMAIIYMDYKKVTWREQDARRNYPHFRELKPEELKYMLF